MQKNVDTITKLRNYISWNIIRYSYCLINLKINKIIEWYIFWIIQICKKKKEKLKESQNKKSMIMNIEIKIKLKWKFEMKKDKYERRKQKT